MADTKCQEKARVQPRQLTSSRSKAVRDSGTPGKTEYHIALQPKRSSSELGPHGYASLCACLQAWAVGTEYT